MSANLATIDGKTAMFSTNRDNPWHGLGQRIDHAATWQEAMELAKLNWTVSKQPLYDAAGNQTPIFGVFRDDIQQCLGAVGNRYEPIQNRYAFDFVDVILGAQDGTHYETAGALGNGERVWCLAAVPYNFTVGSTDDQYLTYLLFSTSHDGSKSATCRLTTTRVVCQNTLNVALARKSDTSIKIKHSRDAIAKLEAAKTMLAGTQVTVDAVKEKLTELAKRKINNKIATDIMNQVFGENWKDSTRKRNQVQEIAQLFESNDANAIPQIRGTAYNMLNAFTEYTDHYRTVKVTEGRSEMTRELIRTQDAVLGKGETMKNVALNAIMEATETAPRVTNKKSESKVESILDMVQIN